MLHLAMTNVMRSVATVGRLKENSATILISRIQTGAAQRVRLRKDSFAAKEIPTLPQLATAFAEMVLWSLEKLATISIASLETGNIKV